MLVGHRRLPDPVGMGPDWMADDAPGEETVTAMGGTGLGRLVDFGAVRILTSGALSLLVRQMGGIDMAAQRFRPNVVVDTAQDPEMGQELRIGEVVLRVILPTPRCVVSGLGHVELPPDRAVLTVLARHYRVPVAGLQARPALARTPRSSGRAGFDWDRSFAESSRRIYSTGSSVSRNTW
jgi:hypothetical protein